jgi:hypothetical protein
MFVSQRQLAFPMVLPPQVPADRLKLLRDAFTAMGDDKAFQKAVSKGGDEESRLMSGADAAAFVGKTFGELPPALLQRIASFGIR